jgi:RNA polymerase sigma factor (TIGR02999 family)
MEVDLVRDTRLLHLLELWQAGDRNALAELTPIVYRELHKLASNYMRRERAGHTLQATALVNEAFMRIGRTPMSFADCSHFYGVAAKLMRHILVDHAKARVRVKRGGGMVQVEVDVDAIASMGGLDIIEIDEALEKLAIIHSEAARAVELHYFGGMTAEETAAVLGVSVSTVGRDIRFAKAWLLRQVRATDRCQ